MHRASLLNSAAGYDYKACWSCL